MQYIYVYIHIYRTSMYTISDDMPNSAKDGSHKKDIVYDALQRGLNYDCNASLGRIKEN